MSTNKNEDFEDSQDIKRQKQEEKRTKDEMEIWEFGRGLVKQKDKKKDVRD